MESLTWRRIHNGMSDPEVVEWNKHLAKAIAEEKYILKERLRAAIIRRDTAWLFSYCIQQRAAFREAITDQLLYGISMYEATEESVEWVMRYMRRLGVSWPPK